MATPNLYSPERLAAMSTNAIIARLDLVACYSLATQRELAPAVKQLHEELDKRGYLSGVISNGR